MRIHRGFRRVFAPSAAHPAPFAARAIAGLGVLALGCLTLSGDGFAQSEQDIRCMQLQQELDAASGGGGNNPELISLNQEINQATQAHRAVKSEMDRAGCYERMLIFGRALKRTPRCLSLNARVEDARRHVERLQAQRASLGGGGNRRRQQELQRAMQQNGCSGAPQSGGGIFDFFGGPRQEYQTPIYRSINPNGRYRTVCVRLCDGFYFPIHYSTYGSQAGQDAQKCQASCAAPAELYVYRNPGQEIEQAISLSGSPYMDLPVALRYRKEFVKGCSCKKAEYNPMEIEAANKRAQGMPADGATQASAAPAAPAAPQAQPEPSGPPPQLNLDIGGTSPSELQITPPPQAAQNGAPSLQVPVPPGFQPPPAAAQAPAQPAPQASSEAPPQGQSSFVKKSAPTPN
ncbi:DUF2865 domain-containing protein [Methyloceanibacter sp. wino2]|uniref:DUF2865 domain-containing protein n=1 Tax=Methyloceanibacter sp. wino2 TaxID=2170729 RepID=UPI00131F2D87|nr:DUF2865 domain-containing protein [Methyloceanibacter sp. wino2]